MLFVKSESAYSSYAIKEIIYGVEDYALCCWSYEGERSRYTKCKIYENAKGEQFIRKYGRRLYLKDFIRI